MTLTFRRLRVPDAAAWHQLRQLAARDPSTEEAEPARAMERAITVSVLEQELRGQWVLGVFACGDLLAVASVYMVNDDVSDQFQALAGWVQELLLGLRAVYVHPSARRGGVASALVLRCLRHAKRRHAGALTLTVKVNNTAAKALYARHGLKPYGDVDGDDMHMRLRFRPRERLRAAEQG